MTQKVRIHGEPDANGREVALNMDANGNLGITLVGATWNTPTFTGTTTFGGGFGSTGATMTAAGALSMDSNLVVTGTSTLTGNTTFGAGYGSTGATLTASNGNFATKGTVLSTGDLTVGASKAVITAATGLTTLDGGATYPAIKVTGAGSTYAGGGAASAYSTGTPGFTANQAALRVYIGSTVYRIPVWTDG